MSSELRETATQMRRRGHSYHYIAKTLGMGHRKAHALVDPAAVEKYRSADRRRYHENKTGNRSTRDNYDIPAVAYVRGLENYKTDKFRMVKISHD
jgi:hypothetical protein